MTAEGNQDHLVRQPAAASKAQGSLGVVMVVQGEDGLGTPVHGADLEVDARELAAAVN